MRCSPHQFSGRRNDRNNSMQVSAITLRGYGGQYGFKECNNYSATTISPALRACACRHAWSCFCGVRRYVDPGNVAANITSGARYGYLLVWVLVLANCMSVLIQYQSAKLGIVTGNSLPEILGERLGDGGRFMFFMQAEVIAIATDLAEVIGGAIALKLLFGLPLFVGGCIIGIISTVLLIFQKSATHHIFERMIIGLLLVITFGFIAGLFY